MEGAAAAARGLPVHGFVESDAIEEAGFSENALYLAIPDGSA
jgi:hypothetical protein